MLDHVGLEVSDLARSRAFYAAALGPLGIELVIEADGWAGFAPAGTRPEGIQHDAVVLDRRQAGPKPRATPERTSPSPAATVRRSRRSGGRRCGHGGRDNGAPGIRGQYHPSYFAAFVLDPDGHNIEAVCHAPA